MINRIRNLFCIALMLSMTPSVFAAKKPAATNTKQARLTKLFSAFEALPPVTTTKISDSDFAAIKKNLPNRRLAEAAKFNESNLSPSFRVLRDDILKIQDDEKTRSEDKLEELIASYNEDVKYNSLDADTKLYVTGLMTLKPFRGITFRLRKLFEPNGFLGGAGKGNATAHAASVSAIKWMAAASSVYLPTAQWTAALRYLITPSKDPQRNGELSTVTEVQTFLIEEVVPVLEKAFTRVDAIAKSKPAQMVWDNRVLYYWMTDFQPANGEPLWRPESEDRYRIVDAADVLATAGALKGALSSIFAFCAYNQDDSLAIARVLGEQMVEEGAIANYTGFKEADVGIGTLEKVQVIRKFGDFGKMHSLGNKSATSMLKRSFDELVLSVDYLDKTWQAVKSQEGDTNRVFNPLIPRQFTREINASISKIKEMIAGETVITSIVTGEIAKINVPAFFNEQTAPRDLQLLMPIEFSGVGKNKAPKMMDQIHNGVVIATYRNYRWGRPLGWNNGEWSKYMTVYREVPKGDKPNENGVPQVRVADKAFVNDSNAAMETGLRILAQSWGGMAIAPLVDFVAR